MTLSSVVMQTYFSSRHFSHKEEFVNEK
jgi:hypothetical protein